jgi:HEAT repeat protein
VLGRPGAGQAAERAAEALRARLADDNWQVVKEAALALGKTRSVASVPALVPLLTSALPDLRKAAAAALGELAPTELVRALEPLCRDPDADVRKTAVRAIAAIQGRGSSGLN